MRNFKAFFIDITKKPPILFPLVGLAHILWLLVTLWGDRQEPFPSLVWLEVVWMVGYTTFWIAASNFRRWGALGYILLTILNASLYLAIRNQKLPVDYLSNMFLIDGVLSVFLLFYYKQFR